mmetsp:Transcript_20348/g.36855  ORF Transcript_20348/g.36855 Transcript_20348/m.36855 type:complete len:977 (-) Transcript_20348:118-3048(-)
MGVMERTREWVSPVLAVVGLYIFATSFFLAKRSLPHTSECDAHSARHLLESALGLRASENDATELHFQRVLSQQQHQHQHNNDGASSQGCWMDRRVDAVAIIVVDALRFDFARERLPDSIGARLLPPNQSRRQIRSQLLQFVADPPTVTMQRLKGLTTGGLPTFADISGSFGGATVDEDSWVNQLHQVPPNKRGYHSDTTPTPHKQQQQQQAQGYHRRPRMAFVGDDTWVDLFPHQFDPDSFPFPSFNTRDLDSVDNGCLAHLPGMLQRFGSSSSSSNSDERDSFLELIVAHFLGVDHVGHTYGPNNHHMDEKLHQMDGMLSDVFTKIDDAPSNSCQVAFVFGDHGMTEDGNHGGGTDEETHAGLFVHYSPGCIAGNTNNSTTTNTTDEEMNHFSDITGQEVGSDSEDAFRSIHQIDLVPTLSILLGLPIPYANLGGLVPSLIPDTRAPMMTAALALNAAQVWNYLTTYSTKSNALPHTAMKELNEILDDATRLYRQAIAENNDDSIAYRQAAGMYKVFLSQATELGKRVWTRFDTTGMTWGIGILVLAVLSGVPSWQWIRLPFDMLFRRETCSAISQTIEAGVTIMLMLFQCVLLTFSNSYIEAEQHILIFIISILCTVASLNRYAPVVMAKSEEGPSVENRSVNFDSIWPIFVIAICSRANEVFVSGHGLDPSLYIHAAHSTWAFIPSIVLLGIARTKMTQMNCRRHLLNSVIDILALLLLMASWWEKRSMDPNRNGFLLCRGVFSFCALGLLLSIQEYRSIHTKQIASKQEKNPNIAVLEVTGDSVWPLLFKLLIFIMAVTGPSTAASGVLFVVQAWALIHVTLSGESRPVRAPVIAALWRLCIRHAFFATGHACSFNRLHYSAAFAATDEFHFVIGGVSLFANTFGWEVMGAGLLWMYIEPKRPAVYQWFCFFQLLETLFACISVSLMRRHLMVWALFAPRFVFAGVFMMLCSLSWLLQLSMRRRAKGNSNP